MCARTHGRQLRVALAVVALAVVALGGCGSGRERQALADPPPATRLVGVWNVRFHLEIARLGRDTAGVPDVRGTLALVQDRRVRQVPQLGQLTHAGSYDVAFRPFGSEPRDVGEVPRVVARTVGDDSVQLVPDPGEAQRPGVLRGVWVGDSITGRWSLGTPSPVAGGPGGRFVVTARR